MKLLHLFYTLCCISLSHAYYGSPDQSYPMNLGIQPIVFQIGSTVYTLEGRFLYPIIEQENITTISIDAEKNLHTEVYQLQPYAFVCQYCAGFVLNDSTVLIFTGYTPIYAIANSSVRNYMGVMYYNPQTNNYDQPSDFMMLPGTPLQRYHQNTVITPDNSSIYVFGGMGIFQNASLNLPIMRLDMTTWTFSQLSNFTYLGGTATMLPSGVVVLAFGTYGFNARTNGTYYDTGSVFLFDTKTNTLSKQAVNGTPPPVRGEAAGVLGPDNECIYYFGGNDFEISLGYTADGELFPNYEFTKTFSDLVILNTSSWTWYTPRVTGLASPARYGAFAVLYDKNTIIIGGGGIVNSFYKDISVLRNLPFAGQTLDSVNLQWFTNSYLDDYYNLSNQGLSTGGIIGVTLGVIILVVFVCYILWKFAPNFKRVIIYVQHEIFWKPRSGEPFWAESSRLITRFILFIAFVAFIVYAIYRTLESPSLFQIHYEYVTTMPMPGKYIRICVQTFDSSTANPFTVQCQLADGNDCSSYFYPLSSSILSPWFSASEGIPSCQLFAPPSGVFFEQSIGTYTNQFKSSMTIKVFGNSSRQDLGIFVTYYAPGYDPNRLLYNIFPENVTISRPDSQDWYSSQSLSHLEPNTFGTINYTTTAATYSLIETETLTKSGWNYIGFANQYNSVPTLKQNVGPLLVSSSSNYDSNEPILLLTVMPDEYYITKSTEIRATTILNGFAQAGGVFGLFIAIQTLLFGFRPDSPWGLIHRWSFGSFRRELGNRLTNQFNKLNTPVPIVNPVHDRFSLKSMKPNTFLFETTPFISNGRDEDTEATRIQRMEERLQLMELVFKSYYINDEVFRHLDEAIKSKSVEKQDLESNSSQTNEELPISQAHHLKRQGSFIDAPIKSDDAA